MQSAKLADISSSTDVRHRARATLQGNSLPQANATFLKEFLLALSLLPLTAFAVAPYIPALKDGALRRMVVNLARTDHL
jgi:hypothetical protein